MDQRLLVSETIGAGSRFLSEFEKFATVKSALWLKASDDDRWYLYIVSDEINRDNFDLAYGEVLRVVHGMQDPKIDPFRVKIIPIDDPAADDIFGIQRSFPRTTPPPKYQYTLGGLSVDDVYVYDLPITSPTP